MCIRDRDDIDDNNGSQDQKWFALERGLELSRAAGECRHDGIRQADFLLRLLDRLHGLAQRTARPQVEGQRHRRELALVDDGQRRSGNFRLGKGAQRHHLACLLYTS